VQHFDTICFDLVDNVGTLTLNRPSKHNAQNPQMWAELRELGPHLVGHNTMRCLVIAGAGPSFSAGIDLVEGLAGLISEIADQPDDERVIERGVEAAGTFSWIRRLRCPSIAAVHGHAYGAGLQLAIACDLRIFANNATVGLTETRYGILPDMGATVRLPRLVGDSRARELILLGDLLGADDALRIGLADRVVDAAELTATAHDLAAQIAAQPPLAVQGARRAIDAAWTSTPDDAFAVAIEEQLRCLRSEDFREARRAMAERRPAQWQGR
jgi:enoyl-CoA hydratase/2-(1,2-epoxy-1,2-dihydrophenyl)acetyl-CoA isomerase